MGDIVGLAIFSLLLFCGLGYPVALMLPKSLPDRFVAAPAFGLALYGLTTSICYRYGVDLRTALLVQSAVALTAVAYLLGREENRLWIATVTVATLMVALLCILPLWVGGYQFAIFQGNVEDQFNYISASSAYAKFGYATLSATSGPQSFVLIAAAALSARPTVGIVLASLWPAFYSTAAEAAYPFLATMQVVSGFGMMFVARNVFGAGKSLSLALMAIFSVSFFIQYVVDINAWSSLSVMSFWPVLVGTICIAVMQPRFTLILPIALLAAGILYFYPESSAVGGMACGGVAISSFLIARPSLFQATKVATVMVSSVVLAGAACIPLWRGTVEFLLGQLTFGPSAPVEWFKAYGAFYSSGYRMLKPIENLKDAILYPIDILAALQGLYFLAPNAEARGVFGVLWRASEGFCVLGILTAATIAIFIAVRAGGARAAFLVGSAAALAVPACLAVSGKYWAAGKAVSMAAPFVFVIWVSPIFVRSKLAVLAVLFLAFQLGFGLQRIYAATRGPVRAVMPYPSIPYLKRDYDWDVERWRNSLAGCKNVSLNLEDVTLKKLKRLAETVVNDLGMQEVSMVGSAGPKADPKYDCEMTDKPDRQISSRVTFLRR